MPPTDATTAEARAACQRLKQEAKDLRDWAADPSLLNDMELVAGWAERAAERIEQLESENRSFKRDLDHMLLCGYPVAHHPDGCPALAAAAAPPAREEER